MHRNLQFEVSITYKIDFFKFYSKFNIMNSSFHAPLYNEDISVINAKNFLLINIYFYVI